MNESALMKRAWWVVAIIVVQFLMGVLSLVIGVFEGWPALVGGLALLTNKRWGWWLALVSDCVLVGTFVHIAVGSGWRTIAWQVSGVAVMSIIATVLLLLPAVRKFYWGTVGGRALNVSS